MIQWVIDNWQILFSGIGATLVAGAITLISKKSANSAPATSANNTTNTTVNVNNNISAPALDESNIDTAPPSVTQKKDPKHCRILFVDDDSRFQVVKIIQKAGYPNVKIVKDVAHLNLPDVIDADIFFIDIQGVGKAMKFNDEGLGLALAIKTKFPTKKVVIYSAQTSGERFHEALRKADSSLPKNAEPFEFIQLVERLSQS